MAENLQSLDDAIEILSAAAQRDEMSLQNKFKSIVRIPRQIPAYLILGVLICGLALISVYRFKHFRKFRKYKTWEGFEG